MQLPPAFPHTRHEQYVVALPTELLTRTEVASAIAVLHRAGLYVRAIAEKCQAELAARGYSAGDIDRAAFPRLPPVLYPQVDIFVGDDRPEAQE